MSSKGIGEAKRRLKSAIEEAEAARPAAPEPRFPDQEHDGDELALSERDIKFLKR